MNEKIRVFIADDHQLVRRGLRAVLAVEPDIDVVGEAATGGETVDNVVQLTPDVVLMDLQMPDISGIEATRQILESDPSIRILVLTLFDDDDSVFLALRAGARGYVLKDAEESEIIGAIRAVDSGSAIFSPAIANRVLTMFQGFDGREARPAFPELTAREREILELIAAGMSNPRIAGELSLSVKTIGNHVSNIFGKLQVADRAEAIVRAREAGLGRGSR
ncbi:MAG: response regulator transcription factor [Thermomicrobiales bacterium]